MLEYQGVVEKDMFGLDEIIGGLQRYNHMFADKSCVIICVSIMWKIEMSILKPTKKDALEFLDVMTRVRRRCLPTNEDENGFM